MATRGRPRALLKLTDTERQTLMRCSRRRESVQALALRCRIVLECADGSSNKDVAARLEIVPATVGKRRAETFELSTGLLFVDKVRDFVGLYLDPLEWALVLCVDEKSRIQALDRTAPVFPMRPGLPDLRTADYLRAGTTTLFAVLDVASGNVIGSMHARHWAIEFKKFLVKLDNEVPRA